MERRVVRLAREHVQKVELDHLRDMVTLNWYNETFGKRDINVARDNIMEERKEIRRLFRRVQDPENDEGDKS